MFVSKQLLSSCNWLFLAPRLVFIKLFSIIYDMTGDVILQWLQNNPAEQWMLFPPPTSYPLLSSSLCIVTTLCTWLQPSESKNFVLCSLYLMYCLSACIPLKSFSKATSMLSSKTTVIFKNQEAQRSWKLSWIFKVTQRSYINICAGKTSLNYIKLFFTACCSKQLNCSKRAIPKGQMFKKMTKGCKLLNSKFRSLLIWFGKMMTYWKCKKEWLRGFRKWTPETKTNSITARF